MTTLYVTIGDGGIGWWVTKKKPKKKKKKKKFIVMYN